MGCEYKEMNYNSSPIGGLTLVIRYTPGYKFLVERADPVIKLDGEFLDLLEENFSPGYVQFIPRENYRREGYIKYNLMKIKADNGNFIYRYVTQLPDVDRTIWERID